MLSLKSWEKIVNFSAIPFDELKTQIGPWRSIRGCDFPPEKLTIFKNRNIYKIRNWKKKKHFEMLLSREETHTKIWAKFFFRPFMTLIFRSSPVAQKIKNLPAMQETWVRSLGQEDLMGKGMATHSSILAWRIPWTEEPGGSWSMGLQTVNMTEQLTHDINFQVYYDAFFLFKKIIYF